MITQLVHCRTATGLRLQLLSSGKFTVDRRHYLFTINTCTIVVHRGFVYGPVCDL